MTLDGYQKEAEAFAVYPDRLRFGGLIYTTRLRRDTITGSGDNS